MRNTGSFAYRAGAWVARRGVFSWVLFLTIAIGGFLFLLARVESLGEPRVSQSASSAPADQPDTMPYVKPQSDWKYTEDSDPMTNVVIREACLASETTAAFGFPYRRADDHLTLCFRQRGAKLDSYLTIDAGQFLCDSYSGCSVAVRADNGTVRRVAASETNDYRSDTIFIANAPALMTQVTKASTLRIQPRFYQEGDLAFEFHTAGLDRARLHR